jgi:hypothetical protein
VLESNDDFTPALYQNPARALNSSQVESAFFDHDLIAIYGEAHVCRRVIPCMSHPQQGWCCINGEVVRYNFKFQMRLKRANLKPSADPTIVAISVRIEQRCRTGIRVAWAI